MGTCASVHKKKSMGFPKRLFPASSSPRKEQQPVDGKENNFGTESPEFDSKDEIFFDSRAWLDSDGDDDFLSVNGDFTPSRGSTPNNFLQRRMPATAKVRADLSTQNFPDSKSEPSPNSRKRLADLLLETLQSEKPVKEQDDLDEEGNANGQVLHDSNSIEQTLQQYATTPPKSQMSEPISASSSEATPSRYAKNRKEGTWNTARCCLPGLVHTFGFDERRQKMSPGPCAV